MHMLNEMNQVIKMKQTFNLKYMPWILWNPFLNFYSYFFAST